jgi:membrane associated rhomboid family serine protease
MATCKECGQEFTPASGGSVLMPSITIDTCPECAKAAEASFHSLLTEATPRIFINPIIIAINLVVFVAMLATGVSLFAPQIDQLLKWGADYGPQTLDGEWWRLLSSVFVHIGVVHLLLNMWCLWSLGRLAERMFGNWTFLALYLLSGLGGSLASVLWNPSIVSAGASGAVFGVAGALVAFWHFGKVALPRSIIKRDLVGILTFVGYNLAFGFAKEGVDNAAHLGGLLVGLALGALLHRPLPATTGRSRLRIGLIYVGAVLILVLVASFARKTHESRMSYERGLRFLENKLNDRAIEEFNHAIASDPTFTLAHHELGVAYLRQDSYEQAINAFKKNLEPGLEARERGIAYHNLGLGYLALSRYGEAIDAFKQSLEINSKIVVRDYSFGGANFGKKGYDRPITAFEQEIELKLDLLHAQISLGKACEAKGLYDQAIAVYKEALELNPAVDVQQKLDELKAQRAPAGPAGRH